MAVRTKILLWSILLLVFVLHGQTPVKQFKESDFNKADYAAYQTKKKFSKAIEKQVLTALSYYPELKGTKIIFRLKKRNTPLTSRPRFFHVFKGKKNRAYVITISTETLSTFEPILFQNLPYNAQIGVLAHEIGHISIYKKKSSFQILGIAFKLLNSKFVDKFEYNTDLEAIKNGMGHQLYDWSVYVRRALNIKEWNGIANSGEERYMNPATIKHHMESLDMYH